MLRMGMNVGGSGGRKADINVTPMIDVLLVLIIIFMVITPEASHGLEAVAPQQSDTPAPANVVSNEIVITIAKDGAIEINQQPVAAGTLGSRLAELYGRHINDHVFVRGDRELDFEAVAQVIDAARGAGWSRIGLMTR
jgi:biopolymer transport protein ExbD